MKSIAPLPNRKSNRLLRELNYRGSMGKICGLKIKFSVSWFIMNLTWRHSLQEFRPKTKTDFNAYCSPLLNILPQVNLDFVPNVLAVVFELFLKMMVKPECYAEKHEFWKNFTASCSRYVVSICTHFAQWCWQIWCLPPNYKAFDFDSSCTQIMIYVMTLLVRNYKQWIFKIIHHRRGRRLLCLFIPA